MNRTPRLLVVGEDQPQVDRQPLDCRPGDGHSDCAGARLRRIFGLDEETYLALGRTNLSTHPWQRAIAWPKAQILIAGPWDVLVLLGAKVRGAFRHALGKRFEEWDVALVEDEGPCGFSNWVKRIICLPHPSGRCQAWNNAKAIERARGILAEYVPDVPWGSHVDVPDTAPARSQALPVCGHEPPAPEAPTQRPPLGRESELDDTGRV